MKKLLLTATSFALLAAFNTTSAQDGSKEKSKDKEKEKVEKLKEKKNSDEIVIRRTGDKNVSVVVEVKDGKVTINGKPIDEFKDENVSVSRRKTSVWNGDDFMKGFNMDHNLNFGGTMPNMAWSEDADGKEIKKAFLGVSTTNNDEGAKITSVTKESAAEKAGLKEGDIIYKIDNAKIEDQNDLTELMATKKPNDAVTVHYKRDGKDGSTKATLGERSEKGFRSFSFAPGQGNNIQGVPSPNWDSKAFTMPNMDVFSGNMDKERMELLNQLGTAHGSRPKIGLKIQDLEEGEGVKVLSTDKDSPAEKAGLLKDDIIIAINGNKVANTDDAREQMKPQEGKDSYSIKAKRNGAEMTFEVKIPKKLKTAGF